MQLIADSGSTKTSWRLLKNQNILAKVTTIGYNPHYLSTTEIYDSLTTSLLPQISVKPQDVEQIHFYGAGCSNESINQTVKSAFEQIFPKAIHHVNSDMLGAARAVCGVAEGIVCILGTGANSCQFDGKKITDNIPPLGFILGDEGSGAYIGKQLIKAYFYREMPEHVAIQFKAAYQLDRPTLFHHLYNEPMPNKYIASFTRFASEHIHEPFIEQLLTQCFTSFFVHHVLKYKDIQHQPIHFIGSIATVFKKSIQRVADLHDLTIGNILKDPIEGLTKYHSTIRK